MTPQGEFFTKREESQTEGVSPAGRLEYSQAYLKTLIRASEAHEAFLAWKIDAEELKKVLAATDAAYVEWLEECRNKEKEKS